MKVATPDDLPPKPRTWGGHIPPWLRDDDPRVRVRTCLPCGTNFWSAGPHNRICPKCSEKIEQMA